MHFETMDRDWFGIPLHAGSGSHEQMNVSVPWGFPTGTTAAPMLTESQRCQILGQAMDLTSMVWFLGVCLAFQQYNTSGLDEHLGANSSGQGAQEDVVLADMGRVAPEESPIWKDSQ